MEATYILFILTSMVYIEGSSTFNISYEHTEKKLTDIPSRSESNRILKGTPIGNREYPYVAQIFLTRFNIDISPEGHYLRCHGVLIAPQWVVTVAHPFDDELQTIINRSKYSNIMWQYVQPKRVTFWPVVRVAIVNKDVSFLTIFDKIYFPDRYDPRYVTDNAVDVALIKLLEPVPHHIASPPSRIDAYLLPDGSRTYPVVQDCWTVTSKGSNVDDFDYTSNKMNVIVGNRHYCTALEKKLHPQYPQVTYNNAEYLCAMSNDPVNPGARVCREWDHGAALMCGDRLIGLLSRIHEYGDCNQKNSGENAYGEYVYLGHSYVYRWIREIVTGKIKLDMRKMYRSEESASGLVEASKTVTWLLAVTSLAVARNTYC